jgi:hypothetical protein
MTASSFDEQLLSTLNTDEQGLLLLSVVHDTYGKSVVEVHHQKMYFFINW